ncbi:hypothetical protein KCP73_00640 [Salmonella enterica subsp. enterica]|nr:hypothetical protein KCP73_00640 [Salmonella enterica subsp. enterica]
MTVEYSRREQGDIHNTTGCSTESQNAERHLRYLLPSAVILFRFSRISPPGNIPDKASTSFGASSRCSGTRTDNASVRSNSPHLPAFSEKRQLSISHRFCSMPKASVPKGKCFLLIQIPTTSRLFRSGGL